MTRLGERVVAVTGGHGVLGRAVVQAALDGGWTVAVIDHARGQTAPDGVKEIGGVDLTDPAQAQAAIDAVVETFGRLKADGIVKEVGVSNANVEELQVAVDVLGEGGLAAVQNEFSPRFNHTSWRELLWCGKRGIAFLPWSPLGGTGGGAAALAERFGVLTEVADAHGVSPQQATLAWQLALGEHVIPVPGASRAASIVDSARAMDLELTADEVERISAALLQR